MEDEFDDSSRYDTAIGWEPPDPYKKLREKARREDPCLFPNPFEKRDGKQMRHHRFSRRSACLLGDLWSEGEVAVLLGETGAGKSVLAVQIAETLARGRRSRPFFPISTDTPAAKRVLFFDLEHTDARFAERYSVPKASRGSRRCRYEFSRKFDRRTLDPAYEMPPVFKGDLDKYLRWAMGSVISTTKPDVVVIDGLAYLASGASADRYATRLMRMLKTWAAEDGISILITAHAKKQARRRPLSLCDMAVSRRIGDLADSVFILGRSTFGEDIRYLKHLKRVSGPVTLGENNVAVYRLDRSAGPVVKAGLAAKNGPASHALSGRTAENQISTLPATRKESSQYPTNVSHGPTALSSPGLLLSSSPSLTATPSLPFLGLTHLGFSSESENHRDYEKELEELFRREHDLRRNRENRTEKPRRLTRANHHPTSARNTADMLLSREYQRYLEP